MQSGDREDERGGAPLSRLASVSPDLLDAVAEGIAVFDPAGRLIGWNAAAAQITGWDRLEAAALLSLDMPDGSRRLPNGRWVALRRAEAGSGATALILTDLTDHQQAERELAVRAAQQTAITELARRSLVADAAGLLTESASLLSAALGVELSAVLELLPGDDTLLLRAGAGWRPGLVGTSLIPADRDNHAGYTLWSGTPSTFTDLSTEGRFQGPGILEDHGVEAGAAVVIQGRERAFGILAAYSREPRTFPPGDVAFLQGIANILAASVERSRVEESIHHSSSYDALTELPNRTLLRERLAEALLAARRTGEHAAALIIGIERFRDINESLGHRVGDRFLRQMANRLSVAVRGMDTVARLDGDEFAVVLPGMPDQAAAEEAVRRILAPLEEDFEVDAVAINMRVCAGLALFPEDGAEPETLLRRADLARTVARERGERLARYQPSFERDTLGLLTLATDLRRAIEREELALHYQPKVDLRTGGIPTVEALVRWRHPVRGLVRPDAFIPVSEQTGLIRALSLWVLHEALREAACWRREGLDLRVAVNLSARTLHDPNLPATVASALALAGVPAEGLELELTESAIMDNPSAALETLSRLHTMGVRLAIDDFGTGYSSLGYLKRLPVHEIKIDKSFVTGMAADEHDATIVRSTVEMVHSLGKEVVAEGVETEEVHRMLAACGCDFAQGKLWSLPLPPDDLRNWLTPHLRRPRRDR